MMESTNIANCSDLSSTELSPAMDIGQRIVMAIVAAIVAWKLFWQLTYLLFGFHLSYITINNGFLFNSIEWSTRKYRITASSVHLRLWNNSKKCLIHNLHVVLLPQDTTKKPKATASQPADSTSLSIYPKNWVGKQLARLLVKIIPAIDLDVRSVTLNHQKVKLDLDSCRVQVQKQNNTHNRSAYRYTCSLFVRQMEGAFCLLDKKIPVSFGQFSVLNKVSFQIATGQLGSISSHIHLDDLKIDMFDLMKSFIALTPTPRKQQNHRSIADVQKQLDILTNLHNKLYKNFEELSFTIANSKAYGIPLFSASDDGNLTEYLRKDEPDSSVRLSVKSVSFHLSRVEHTAAGFDVLFDSFKDRPLDLTMSALLLKLSFVTKKFHEKCGLTYNEVDEFFSFPNFSFTFKSNVIDNLAAGQGFKNCVIESFMTGSSPILDVDTDQFALLAYNYVVVRKLLKWRKIKKSNPDSVATHLDADFSDSESDDDTQVANSTPGTPVSSQKKHGVTRVAQIIDKVISLLDEFYPKIDFKFTVEQPRAVIRLHNEKSTQFLILSFSTLSIHALTTDLDDYVAKVHILHPCMTFGERYETSNGNSHYQEEFLGLSHTRVRIDVMKNLKMKVSTTVAGAFVSLAKPDVLNGINSIIKIATREVNYNLKNGPINIHYDTEIVKEREVYAPQSNGTEQHLESIGMDLIISPLPSWLIEVELKFMNVNVKLGSASPLLPLDLISKLSEVVNRSVDDTKSFLNFSIDEFKWKLQGSEISETMSTISMASLDTLIGREKPRQAFWMIHTITKDVSLCLIEDGVKTSPILNVPNIGSSLSAVTIDNKPKVLLDFDIDEVLGFLDRYRLFAMIGLIYLLKVTIIEPLQMLKEKIGKSTAILQLREHEKRSTSFKQYLLLDFNIGAANLIVALSDDFKIRLQLYSFAAEVAQGSVLITNDFTRLLADSPIVNGYWNRMVCLDSLSVKVNDPNESHKLVFDTSSLRIIQPHKFVVYKFFDNLGIFVKVAKHLLRLLNSEKKPNIVFPKESAPLKVPHMRVKASKVMYTIEDDPFEAELNMIYQLGLVEQRKRLEIMDLFEERCNNVSFDKDDYQEKLSIAQKTIETLWVRKVKLYKARVADEIIKNKDFLFGDELKIPEGENQRVTAYYKHPPLLRTIMSGLDLDLSSPHFSMEDLPDFIYEYGQKVPKKTRYNLMLPTHIHLVVDELRMHMRDYPIPLLYLPKCKDPEGGGKALVMKGHLVISEALIQQKEHLRRLEVQLSRNSAGSKPDSSFDKLIIEKSMSTIKIFSDLDILFDSRAPARFVWGNSYQFAIQHIMLSLDQFSKPPVDPSKKLGFWDKLRLILHGKCKMRTGKYSSIEVAIKGGRDPYDLFTTSSGFILAFKEHVQWNINEDENPSHFFDILSRKVSWYVPNYLNEPLVCWCRDSSKPTFLAANKNLITSCHAYYLDESPVSQEEQMKMNCNIMEKRIVDLSGGVRFVLGFLLQRKTLDDKITEESKPHWEIELCNPEYTKKGHDTYAGFRTDRLHMAISLVANSDTSYNTFHLSPRVFKQFFSWWKLFDGNMMLPIRKGKIFREAKEIAKFSEHLFTIKYLFDLKNLFLSHVQTDHALDDNEEFVESVGLRAKMDRFMVDLHQRKEPRIDEHEDLSRQKKILKMSFNRGEVTLTKIDLRAILAKFEKNVYNQDRSSLDHKCKYVIFDNDYQWFDSHDFDEAFVPSSKGRKTRVDVLPLMYSEKFSYIRDTSSNDAHVDWGHEQIHDCMLNRTDIFSTQVGILRKRLADLEDGVQKSEDISDLNSIILDRIDSLKKNIKVSEMQRKKLGRKDSIATNSSVQEHFHNRFVLISMFLKWNEKVRNLFMKYIHFVQLNSNFRKYLSHEFISMLENLVNKNDLREDDALSLASSAARSRHSAKELKNFLSKFQSSQERLDNFDEIIRVVKDSEMFTEDYKVEIISPQIQLASEMDKNSVVLITAPILEAKILSIVTKKDSDLALNPKELEDRYGFVMRDACVMVLDKQGLGSRENLLEKRPYGTTSNWPPFLGIEVCRDNSLAQPQDILIKKMSLLVTYDQVKALGSNIELMEGNTEVSLVGTGNESEDDRLNRFRVDCPELVIDCTAKQYFTLYVTLLSLLLYSEPMSVSLREKISKLKFSINFQNFSALHGHLLGLHKYLGGTKKILSNYSFRNTSNMDNEALNEYLFLHSEEKNIGTEIVLILQTIFSGDVFADSSAQPMEDWRIAADRIVLHMHTDEREPILDLKIDGGVFKRIVKEDGSNDNRIEIRNIEGVNKFKNAYYDKFLEAISPENEDLITVEWSMNRSIGGIRIMESFEASSQPLNMKIDEAIGRALMEFIFHSNDDDDDGPLVNVAAMKEVEAAVREREEVTKDNDKNGPEASDSEEEKSKEERSEEEKSELEVPPPGRKRANTSHSREVRFGNRSRSSSNRKVKKKSSTKDISLNSGSDATTTEFDDNVAEMVQRSKQYLTVVSMKCHSVQLMISLRMKKGLTRWLNVTNFMLTLPEWNIELQVISLMEIAKLLQKNVTGALLLHSFLIVKNKMTTRARNARQTLKGKS